MDLHNKTTFPRSITLICILFSGAMFVFGAFILTRFHWMIAALYLVCCCAIELFIVQKSKGWCYYYGKMYAFGKSWPTTLKTMSINDALLKKNNDVVFVLLQILILVVPIAVGAERLWSNFSWFCLGLIVSFVMLYLLTTFLLRGSFMKRYIH